MGIVKISTKNITSQIDNWLFCHLNQNQCQFSDQCSGCPTKSHDFLKQIQFPEKLDHEQVKSNGIGKCFKILVWDQ